MDKKNDKIATKGCFTIGVMFIITIAWLLLELYESITQ